MRARTPASGEGSGLKETNPLALGSGPRETGELRQSGKPPSSAAGSAGRKQRGGPEETGDRSVGERPEGDWGPATRHGLPARARAPVGGEGSGLEETGPLASGSGLRETGELLRGLRSGGAEDLRERRRRGRDREVE